MSNNSINANTSALLALQGLNQTTTDLQAVQTRVSTGLDIAAAKDNAGTWGIATDQRSAISSLDPVKASLNRAQSSLDVALSAGQTVSDLLNQIRSKTLAGTDTSLDTASRNVLSNDVQSLIKQITLTVTNSDFNGVNLVKTGGTILSTLTDADTSVLTVQPRSLAVGGANIPFTVGSTFSTATQATALLALVDNAIPSVNRTVGQFAADSKAVSSHLDFVSTFQDTLTLTVGNLVDADVAKESAALTALQVKQQLGVQTLSIANSSRDVLLSLFK